jgi:outer membrane lipoprotein LolB
VRADRRRFALATGALLISGCATRPAQPADFRGRLALRIEGDAERSFSADFELQGSPDSGRLVLSTALGLRLAEARWSRLEAVLDTGNGSPQSFTDLEAMTREIFGETVPVSALFDWLRGRPWPKAPSRALPAPETGFSQIGWSVLLERFADGQLVARRDRLSPPLSLRIRLDSPSPA